MRHLPGLRNVGECRSSGTSASPLTLTITADVDPGLITAMR
jgi:hypothetical protein